MSVNSEITRLSNARTAIGTAIAEKGVTVPSGTKIDGMAILITQISTGVDTSDANATSGDILSGKSAYVNGSKVNGSITSKAAATYNTSTSDQSISAGQYLSGAQTIKAVTTSNIDAGNIKDGVTVKVGDANDDDRIKGVTGTFTDASTVSTGQTAATASKILSGYSAWVDGAEVKGNIATKTSSNLSVSGATITAPAGYYASNASASVSNGSATAPASISGSSATVTPGTNTLTLSKTVSVTPSVTAGYVSSGTSGNSAVSLTASVTTKAAATITPGTTDQTISSGTYLTGAQTIKGDANLIAANIKAGVTIFGITGTYTGNSTVSSGQTAAAAGQILSGYSAWVNGVEVKGSLSAMTSSQIQTAVNAGWV